MTSEPGRHGGFAEPAGLAAAAAAPAGACLEGESRPEFLREETLADIFRATAAAWPGKVALGLIGTDEALTYAELDRRSDRVASALAERGVRIGDFVGLWFRRSLDLHVALLGILKAGAAFVPFDADAPAERVAASLRDAGARLLLTHDGLADKAAGLPADIAHLRDLLSGAPEPIAASPGGAGAAYAIYTSGSTGTPKGIVVTHRNICHYLRAGNAFLGIGPADVVLQQASIAFDLSLEEIFVPYLAGATLKVATSAVLQDMDRLPDMLEAEGITVIDTVPTLLAMFGRDVAGLSTIILGGEACPPALLQRFARPGRRILNTYGPTETTVVATFAELSPGEAVTIGRPIANATAYVVDENLDLVAPGTVGELLVGGPGVAPGYLNLPDLTARKFIANPFRQGGDPVLYRTGDAVSLGVDGTLAFHGRIDDQVKIRGYRIELGEIETLIAALPGVQAAAVVVQQGGGGDMLAAHVVPVGEGFDPQAAKRAVAAKVPPYMVPAAWQTHAALPRLSSGKVDRKALAALPLQAERTAETQPPPGSWTEARLLKAAQEVFRTPVVDLEADFFTELGGHSMLAAQFVSEVRRVPALAGMAIRDVYAHRSLRAMAAALDAGAAGAMGPADLSFEPVPLRRRVLCGLAQAAALPFIIGIVTAEWIGLLLSSMLLIGEDAPLWQDVLVLSGIYLSLNLGVKLLVVALKWLVIGRTRPGVYPLWGAYYFRIWLMQRIVQLTSHKFLKGSPLMRVYLRALGAGVGRDAMIDEFEEGAVDLVSIGERASLGTKLKLANVEVIGNQVHVGRIEIGAGVQVGNGCVIGGDAVIGAGAVIGDLTAIPAGAAIPAGTHWEGSPARRTGLVAAADPADHPTLGTAGRLAQGVGYFVAYNLSLIVGLLPIFPAFFVLDAVHRLTSGDPDASMSWGLVAALSWPAALVLIVVSMAAAVMLRWLLQPRRVQPGAYSIFSGFYFRKWVIGLSTESILETLNSLYATVFMRNWYRLMGARIGRGTEISASFAGRYDLIEMGANNFIGDEAVFGDEEIVNGRMVLKRMKTGDRCFFGNSAVIAQGSVIEDGALIGIKTRLPASLRVEAGQSYCGSPPISLPTRQRVEAAAAATYEPPFRMWLLRVAFETLHTSLPTAVLIMTAYFTADILAARLDQGAWTVLGLFMAAGLVTSLAMYLMAVACKWLLIGTCRPTMRPMWSWWAMRTEAVAVIYGGLASKMLLDYLRGTPFLPWLLRPFGTRIGKGTWINSTDICEFDCTEIGDHAVINMGACPQTHLYEDRIMKVGRIRIGRGATVGTAATVLYDTEVGAFAEVKPLTLIMKGEAIPASTAWVGIPAQLVAGETARALAPAPADVRPQALDLSHAAE